MNGTKRQYILDTAKGLMDMFLYYDRKEDEDLQVGDIEKAIEDGEVTVEEILNVFETALRGPEE